MKMDNCLLTLVFGLSMLGSLDGCDIYAAEGQNVTVQLDYNLQNSDFLKWRRNDTIIFYQRRKTIVIKAPAGVDIYQNGSLKLTNLKKSNTGTYTPDVHTQNGISAKEFNPINLCISDSVPDPEVTIECSKTTPTMVTFTCNVGKAQGLTFQWLKNKKEMKEKTQILRQKAEDVEDSFECKVSNPVLSKTSKAVQHMCTSPTPITVTLNPPSPKTIFSNNQAELECIITGRDNTIVSETKITWQIDEQNVNSNITEMTIREGSQYRKISTLTRSHTEWQKVNRVRCSAISGNMTPVTQDLTVHKGDGRKPTVTVHIPAEEDIKGDSAVTLMCLISSPVQQDYYIAWSEDAKRRTRIYTDGITFLPQKTQRGYTVINVYTTTKEKWNQGYVFYCNVWPAGSNESMIPRGVSKAMGYSLECD